MTTSPLDHTRLNGGSPTTAYPLVIESVTKTFRDGAQQVKALDKVSLTLEPGELVAVMGRSGSGKTTLLNIAGTLDQPDEGRILLNGANPAELDAGGQAKLRRTHVGFIFQEYNLIPSLTVAENIALPLELDGISVSDSREQVLAILEEMQLSDIADAFPSEISGGQAQRVAIARAVVGPRNLILADEPTGALDTATGEEIMSLLRARITGQTAGLLVTHEPRFAAWADRTITLRDGKILETR